MADFVFYETKLDASEGVFGDDKADAAGGQTVYGIARKQNPGLDLWPIFDRLTAGCKTVEEIRAKVAGSPILREKARPFRKAKYWDPLRLDKLPSQRLAEEMADGAFNTGMMRRLLMLRRALNVMNRKGQDWADRPLGTPSKLTEGLTWEKYELLPIYFKTQVLMIYPPSIPYSDDDERALYAAISKGFEDELYKGLGSLRIEWTYAWMERNPEREELRGLLDRPIPEI